MKKRTILVCDDNPQIARSWRSQIQQVCPRGYVAESLPQDQLVEAISQLEERRKNARKRRGPQVERQEGRFDEADVLIIDYDLLNLSSQSYLTGESLAYLARCYSRCKLIVGLNEYGTNDFDLSLKGHPESYADLNVGGRQVSNPGLWTGKWDGFRPWHWPLIPLALEAHERRVRELNGHLDESILSFLSFDDADIQNLPRSTKEFLGRRNDVAKTTFREFVATSGNGMRTKDNSIDDDSIARVAAARIWKWLERMVLSGQDILVDAPHLVYRYPSLLKGTRTKLSSWDKTATLDRGDKIGVDVTKLSKCRFRKNDWLSRPAWFWKCVSKTSSIKEVESPWGKEDLGFVFCEDISRFLPRAATRSFVADLPSPFVQRFAADPSKRQAKRFSAALRGISYRPQVRFSL
jgi:hypothetical protein